MILLCRFVASLETDLTVRAKTTEVGISDFSSGSYTTIFTEEVRDPLLGRSFCVEFIY